MHKSSFPLGANQSRPDWFDEDTEKVQLQVVFDLVDASPSSSSSTSSDVQRFMAAVKRHLEPKFWNRLLASRKPPRRKWHKRTENNEGGGDRESPDNAPISRTAMKLLLPMLSDKIFLDEVIG